MARPPKKPPATPPSSDIDGVDEDRHALDDPAGATPAAARRDALEQAEAKGRPRSSRP